MSRPQVKHPITKEATGASAVAFAGAVFGASQDGLVVWDGTLTVLSTVPHSFLATADIDGDGKTDCLAVSSEEIAWYNGDFDKTTIGPASGVTAVALGDVDGDQAIDLVIAGPDGVSVFQNKNGFSDSRLLLPRKQVRALAVGDVDGDGVGNVVLAFENAVVWYDGDEHVISRDGGALSLALGDLNSDGRLDVIVGGRRHVSWYENSCSASVDRRLVEEFAPSALPTPAPTVLPQVSTSKKKKKSGNNKTSLVVGLVVGIGGAALLTALVHYAVNKAKKPDAVPPIDDDEVELPNKGKGDPEKAEAVLGAPAPQ